MARVAALTKRNKPKREEPVPFIGDMEFIEVKLHPGLRVTLRFPDAKLHVLGTKNYAAVEDQGLR